MYTNKKVSVNAFISANMLTYSAQSAAIESASNRQISQMMASQDSFNYF